MLAIVAAAAALGSFCEYDILTLDRSRKALAEDTRLWIGGVVPFVFTPEVSDSLRSTVRQVMRDIEAVAAVSFTPFVRGPERVVISTKHPENPGGCWATVGRYETAKVNFGWCREPRHVTHELLHVLGMWHEQSRSDADSFLTMNRRDGVNDCIIAQQNDRGYDYDFRSIMHYPLNSLGASLTDRGRARLAEQHIQAQRVGYFSTMSSLDANSLATMYGRGEGVIKTDTDNSALMAGLIGGGVGIAVLGLYFAFSGN